MTNLNTSDIDLYNIGSRVLEKEAVALTKLAKNLSPEFSKACQAILEISGRVIVTGMGKSGHIGKKIAATLASTGTPSFFMHPAEGSHGDLGMVTSNDVVLALSNSGETDEVVTLLPLLRRLGVKIIAITGNPQSTLSKNSNYHLQIEIDQEACSLGLAPTTSTTLTLAMGDALAIALLEARGFTSDDFAFSHPAGKLGKKLLIKVADIMHSGDNCPIVTENTALPDVLYEISRKRLGMTLVVSEQNPDKVIGICTDGDLRRAFNKDCSFNVMQTKAKDIMTTNFISIGANILAAQAVKIFQDKKINALPVIDENNKILGAFNMHDLFTAGVV